MSAWESQENILSLGFLSDQTSSAVSVVLPHRGITQRTKAGEHRVDPYRRLVVTRPRRVTTGRCESLQYKKAGLNDSWYPYLSIDDMLVNSLLGCFGGTAHSTLTLNKCFSHPPFLMCFSFTSPFFFAPRCFVFDTKIKRNVDSMKGNWHYCREAYFARRCSGCV